MLPATPSRVLAAQVALVGGPVLAGVSAVTQPDLDGDAARQLAAIAADPLAALSAAGFAVSQLCFLVAVLAIGRLLLPRAPRLSSWGTALGVSGAFGHAVYGGVMLTFVTMAGDTVHRSASAALMEDLQDSPVMLFSVVGLAGTVLGLVLFGVGLVRTATGPHWVGPLLWAFVVVEFAGGAVSSMASYLSMLLLLVAFGALARQLRIDAAQTPSMPAVAEVTR